MYLKCVVPIPEAPGKITRLKKGNAVYIRYTVGRKYDSDKKYNVPDHKIIGKLKDSVPGRMIPNENFLKYFSGAELPEIAPDSKRSSCLRIGNYLVIRKIMEDYHLPEMLGRYMPEKDCGLFLDLAAYSIITENNAAQYYPDYAFNHPLFTQGMHMYSDTKVSGFLESVTDEQRVGFLNEWNAARDHREKIYISYDSTNKNCQAGDIEIVEFGHPKVDKGLPVFNYTIAYDTDNKEPLYYEQYPGSIVDVSQLQYMLDKAKGYGYRHVGFILDRGYFCKENIQFMDSCGYDFIIIVKGMASFVKSLVLEAKGTFEGKRLKAIRKYKVYGTTLEKNLYASDEKERYFHIYYSDEKAYAEREQAEAKIERMANCLKKQKGKKFTPGEGLAKYFRFEIYEKDGTFLYARERADVIEEELSLCGYFVIVTSKKMTAEAALEIYKSRDASEKLFRGDKSYLGNGALRVQTDRRALSKIFIEFVALIVRSRMYVLLKEEMEKLDKKPNYMTVPAAVREMEKIEMIKGYDGRYRLDHAVTKTQKTILKAFEMDNNYVRKKAADLSDLMAKYSDGKEREGKNGGEAEKKSAH